MTNRILGGFLAIFCTGQAISQPQSEPPALAGGGAPAKVNKYVLSVQERIDAEAPELEKLYQTLHANPELSLMEEQSSARMAKELQQLGFTVTTKVGGHGVVGVLKNGDGPTVLVRADMDALPIIESTGLPYASKVRARDKDGNDVGVMHACGHDMHMTCLVGTARVLARLKDRWQGTLVFIGPAGRGNRRRRPHDARGRPASRASPAPITASPCTAIRAPRTATSPIREGMLMANVDTVDIIVHGQGRPRLGAAHDHRPDRPVRPHHPRSANDREPGSQSDRSRRWSRSARSTAAPSTTSFRPRSSCS